MRSNSWPKVQQSGFVWGNGLYQMERFYFSGFRKAQDIQIWGGVRLLPVRSLKNIDRERTRRGGGAKKLGSRGSVFADWKASQRQQQKAMERKGRKDKTGFWLVAFISLILLFIFVKKAFTRCTNTCVSWKWKSLSDFETSVYWHWPVWSLGRGCFCWRRKAFWYLV